MKFLLVNTNQIVQKLVEITAKKSGANLTSVAEISQAGDLAQFDYVMIDDDCLSADRQAVLEALKECRKCLIHNKQGERIEGFNDYVQKPFLPTAVLDIFTNELSRAPSAPKGSEGSGESLEANLESIGDLGDSDLGGLGGLDSLDENLEGESGGVSLENLDEGLGEIDSLLEDESLDVSASAEPQAQNAESVDLTTESGTEIGIEESLEADMSSLESGASEGADIALGGDDDGLDVELDLSNLDEIEGFGDGTGLGDEADAMAEVVAKVSEAEAAGAGEAGEAGEEAAADLDSELPDLGELDSELDSGLDSELGSEEADLGALDTQAEDLSSVEITESELQDLDGLSDELSLLDNEALADEALAGADEAADKGEDFKAESEAGDDLGELDLGLDSDLGELEALGGDEAGLDEPLAEAKDEALELGELDSELDSEMPDLGESVESAESVGEVERDETESALLAKELDSELNATDEAAAAADLGDLEATLEAGADSELSEAALDEVADSELSDDLGEQDTGLDSDLGDLEGAESMDSLLSEALEDEGLGDSDLDSETDLGEADVGVDSEGLEAEVASEAKPLLDEDDVSDVSSALASLEGDDMLDELGGELDSEIGATDEVADLGESADEALDEAVDETANEVAVEAEEVAVEEAAEAAVDSEKAESGEAADFSTLKEPEVAHALGEEIEGLEEEAEAQEALAAAEEIQEGGADELDSEMTQPQALSESAPSAQAMPQDGEIVKNMIASSVQSSISSLNSGNLKSMLDGLEVTINISFKDKSK